MKKTRLKDILRNITKQKVSFLSIVIIGMMALACFTGVNFAGTAVSNNLDEFYSETNYRDFQLVSSILLSKDDIEKIRQESYVADVEELYMVSGDVETGEGRQDISVLSLTERINKPILKEGRLPEKADECVLEIDFMEKYDVKIGDTVDVGDLEGLFSGALYERTFTVTGGVVHPDHFISLGLLPEERYVLVTKDAFDPEAAYDRVMAALVSIKKPEGMSYMSDEYNELCEEANSKLSELTKRIGEEGNDYVQEKFDEYISDGEKQLREGKQKLDDARRELDKNSGKLEEAETKLQEARTQLDDAKVRLEEAKKELDKAEKKVKTGKEDLDAAKRKLDSGKKDLESGYRQIAEGKNEILSTLEAAIREKAGDAFADKLGIQRISTSANVDDPALSVMDFAVSDNIVVRLDSGAVKNADALINALKRIIGIADESVAEYVAETVRNSDTVKDYKKFAGALLEWEKGHDEYIDGLIQYKVGKAEYEAGLEQFNNGKKDYEKALADYEKGEKDYADGLAQFNDGKKQYEDGEQQYAEGLEQYEAGAESLEDNRARRSDLPIDYVYVYGLEGSLSYNNVRGSIDNLKDVSRTFSMLFVIIAALVIFATIGRIVGEHRTLIGTQKALGFFKREIYTKYLAFGVLSTLTGMIAGTLVGYLIMQRFTLDAQSQFFIIKNIPLIFDFRLVAILVSAGVVMAFAVVMISCSSLVRESAKDLLMPALPKTVGKKSKKSAAGGSLYSRLIRRNIRADLGRVIVTVVSVAGCCILLSTGLCLRSGVKGAISGQFEEITKYDLTIYYRSWYPDTKESIVKMLDSEKAVYTDAYISNRMVMTGNHMNGLEMIVLRSSDADGLITFPDEATGKRIELPEMGIVLQNRFADAFEIEKADKIRVIDSEMALRNVFVTGIVHNYIGRTAYMSAEAYEASFGQAPQYNALLVRGVEDVDAFIHKLSEIEGYERTVKAADIRDYYTDMTSSVDSIILLLLFTAALMAVFVLLNLVNMHLNHKKRELTVMRINGFSTREVINYVLREAVVTTLLGIILGVVAGQLIADMILYILEQPQVSYLHSISPLSALVSAGLTIVYAGVIYFIATRKIKKLKLSDVA